MTSEVKADLIIELSDLNYLCSHASLACKGFLEIIPTDDNNGQLLSIDLRASPQVKEKTTGPRLLIIPDDNLPKSEKTERMRHPSFCLSCAGLNKHTSTFCSVTL